MKSEPSKNYDAYAQIYDDFKGSRADNVRLLRSLIEKYRPDARTLLDLACGTGGIAQSLIGSYVVVGVDNSPHMLQIATRKLPSMKFVETDMTNFALEVKFDVVYCLHNSVNHLTTFSDWKAMLSNVVSSLNKGGVFIFDLNPIEKMDMLAQWGMGVTQVGEDYVITQVTHDSSTSGLYSWDIKIFLKQSQDNFSLQSERIKVAAYPLNQIKETLIENFDIAESFILDHAEKTEDIGRAYFVCIKK